MGKDLGKERKGSKEKRDKKESIQCSHDAAEYARQEDSAERVLAIWA